MEWPELKRLFDLACDLPPASGNYFSIANAPIPSCGGR